MDLFYHLNFFPQCPFHGKIIGRDNMGRPTNKEDAERLAKEEAAKNGESLINYTFVCKNIKRWKNIRSSEDNFIYLELELFTNMKRFDILSGSMNY